MITAPAISPLSPLSLSPGSHSKVPGPWGPVVYSSREHWTPDLPGQWTGGDISWVIVVVMAATLLSYVPAHLGDAEKTERKLL